MTFHNRYTMPITSTLKLPKNPLGGLKVIGLGKAAKWHTPEQFKRMYGPSIQCPDSPCGHVVSDAQWNPQLSNSFQRK